MSGVAPKFAPAVRVQGAGNIVLPAHAAHGLRMTQLRDSGIASDAETPERLPPQAVEQ